MKLRLRGALHADLESPPSRGRGLKLLIVTLEISAEDRPLRGGAD